MDDFGKDDKENNYILDGRLYKDVYNKGQLVAWVVNSDVIINA